MERVRRTAQSEAEILRRQLVGRAQMGAAADWLERRPQPGREVFARGVPEAACGSGRTTDITDLLRACLVALRVPEEQAAVYRPRLPRFWTVSEAMGRILVMLEERPEGVGLGAFLPEIDAEAPGREVRCRAAVASTLVAGLELARGGMLNLDQRESGSPIMVSATAGLPVDRPPSRNPIGAGVPNVSG